MAKKKYVPCELKYLITPRGPKSRMSFDTLGEAELWNKRVGINFPIEPTLGTLETRIAPISVMEWGIYGKPIKVWRPLKNNEKCRGMK
jgi:hypothetical protein